MRSDHVLAEAALAEGSATAVMADYAERHLGPADVLSVAEAAEGAAFPEYIERQLLFPYIAGQEFVSVLRGESGGWDAVDSVYRLRRPRTTEQVIHPRKFAAGEDAARVPPPSLRAVLPAPWRRLRSASVGEFDLQMLVEPRVAPGARGRGVGRRTLRAVAPPGAGVRRAPCLRADLAWIGLRWDTPTDRAEGEAALRTAVERVAKPRGAVGPVGTGVRTTVALAPDARTARAAVAGAARRGEPVRDRGSCGTIAPGRLWGGRPKGRSTIGEKRAGRPGRAASPACAATRAAADAGRRRSCGGHTLRTRAAAPACAARAA